MAETAHAHDPAHDHAHDEEKKLAPKFELQDAGPCKVRIKVEVAAPAVKERIDGKYRELADSVALPGFRKGHAPRNLLERKFGKAMLDDLKFELLSASFEEIKEEKKLEPVGEPQVAEVEKLAVEEGKPFAYEVTVEVRPNVDVKDYVGLKASRPAVQVSDADVEAALRGLLESRAELEPVEGAAAEGDQMIADFALVVEGKTVDQAEDNALFLNPTISFYGMELADFYTSVVGKAAGAVVEYSRKLPDDFSHKEYAGKDALIRTTVKSLKRKKLPTLDAEFVKKQFDLDSVDELKEDLRKRLLKEKGARADFEVGEKLVEALIQANDFPMPQGLIDSGTEEALRRAHLDLAVRGVPEAEIQATLEKEKTGSRENMAKALKAHFILEHIAGKEKIFVTEDQIEERIGQLAAQAGRWPHEMRAYLEEQGLLPQLRRKMREELVREFLLSKAVIEEEKA